MALLQSDYGGKSVHNYIGPLLSHRALTAETHVEASEP